MMLERNLITTKGAKYSSQYIGKPLDEIFFSSWFHISNNWKIEQNRK